MCKTRAIKKFTVLYMLVFRLLRIPNKKNQKNTIRTINESNASKQHMDRNRMRNIVLCSFRFCFLELLKQLFFSLIEILSLYCRKKNFFWWYTFAAATISYKIDWALESNGFLQKEHTQSITLERNCEIQNFRRAMKRKRTWLFWCSAFLRKAMK